MTAPNLTRFVEAVTNAIDLMEGAHSSYADDLATLRELSEMLGRAEEAWDATSGYIDYRTHDRPALRRDIDGAGWRPVLVIPAPEIREQK